MLGKVLIFYLSFLRLEARDAHGAKKSKITRDRERDVTEKVALGMAQVDRTSGEAMYDTRLFNQEKGLATGFGDDEAYNLYDKPLFAERGSGLYKIKKTQDSEIYGGTEEGHKTDRFKASQGFQVRWVPNHLMVQLFFQPNVHFVVNRFNFYCGYSLCLVTCNLILDDYHLIFLCAPH